MAQQSMGVVRNGVSAPPEVSAYILASPWKAGLEPADDVNEEDVEVIQGKVPQDLDGTLYRNGPGRIRVGRHLYGHWFDGDGYVTKLRVDGASNSATFAAKYVRTDRFKAQEEKEADAGFQSRGAWTQRSGGLAGNFGRSPTNPSNTATMMWNGALLSLCEGGPPIKLDPESLETIGEYRIPGLDKGAFFSAHPKVDTFASEEGNKVIYNNGLVLGYPIKLRVYEVNERQGVTKSKDIVLEDLVFVHDFAVTKDFIIFMLQPYICPLAKVLSSGVGANSLGTEFKWLGDSSSSEGRQTRVVVLAKEDLSTVLDEKIPAFSFDHVINAFQEDDGKVLKVQFLRHGDDSREELEEQRFNMYAAKFTARHLPVPTEVVINLGDRGAKGSGDGSESIFVREVSPVLCELPVINKELVGQKARFAYANSEDGNQQVTEFLKSVAKIDLITGEYKVKNFGPDRYADEPVFVKRKGATEEDDGYLLTYVYDTKSKTAEVVILDAKQIDQDQAIATIRLNQHVPYSFHGDFVERKEFERC